MTKKLFPIIDGHNDTLLRTLREDGFDFFKRNPGGHIDLPRAREGGLAGGFFAVYIPNAVKARRLVPKFSDYATPTGYAAPLAKPLKLNYARKVAFKMIANLFRIEAESGGQVRIVRAADELEACIHEGVLAMILHFEGAEAIDEDLDALEVFYRAGLRSLGPVWSRTTIFGHGVSFEFPRTPDTGPGLTDAGRALVKACNRLGIMIDLSHITEQGFWDVAKLSDAPLVATHSNAHALCPLTRNLTDKQLDAIKETDGMVGLNFGPAFLREDGGSDLDTPLEVMVRHIDYLVKRVGLERVGFGSDFDGVTVPTELEDAAGLPKLVDALRAAGYDDDALNKITHQNWIRVLRKTWK